MTLHLPLTLAITWATLTLLTSCGDNEQPLAKEPVVENQEEPMPLTRNSTSSGSGSESTTKIEPKEDDSALLADENLPNSIEDAVSSIREVNEDTEPSEAAKQLRLAAAFINAQPAVADPSEQGRLDMVNTHLRSLASKLEQVKNAEDMKSVLGQLQGMMQMYMP